MMRGSVGEVASRTSATFEYFYFLKTVLERCLRFSKAECNVKIFIFEPIKKTQRMKGWMYILLCSDGSYYTGSTNDLNRRIGQHQLGEGANHTKKNFL